MSGRKSTPRPSRSFMDLPLTSPRTLSQDTSSSTSPGSEQSGSVGGGGAGRMLVFEAQLTETRAPAMSCLTPLCHQLSACLSCLSLVLLLPFCHLHLDCTLEPQSSMMETAFYHCTSRVRVWRTFRLGRTVPLSFPCVQIAGVTCRPSLTRWIRAISA